MAKRMREYGAYGLAAGYREFRPTKSGHRCLIMLTHAGGAVVEDYGRTQLNSLSEFKR